ncbi:hypothetical protein QGN29_01260 [Temperatibacter marinus]|uniref:Uncharacterized protein n=1 Tax=Temperatibacter marinus TaxID=1456591 RepID=A0AA52H9X1_9PROT|nr:hypothetical protein [Temperatibacter marinus]WND02992.1 hypothetical protein QGN29_01260 [Temperatibacter marinus]
MIFEVFVIGTIIHMTFVFWYRNFRGPMKPAEIEKTMDDFSRSKASETTKPEDFRKFLEEDDGKEFFIANYIELKKSSEDMSTKEAQENLHRYYKPFAKALLRRAGHPVYMVKRVGNNIDTWNIREDLDYPVMSMMRYRSRRDFAEILSDDKLPDVHKFKLMAIERTISFPIQFRFMSFMNPFYWVPCLILLICFVLSFGINTFL